MYRGKSISCLSYSYCIMVRGEAFVFHVHARAVDVLGRARTRRREARGLHAGELLARVHLPRQLRAGLVLQVGVQCVAWLSASATGGGSSSAAAESSPAVLPLPTGTARPDSEQRTSSAPSRSGGGAGAPRRMSAICARCGVGAPHSSREEGFALAGSLGLCSLPLADGAARLLLAAMASKRMVRA